MFRSTEGAGKCRGVCSNFVGAIRHTNATKLTLSGRVAPCYFCRVMDTFEPSSRIRNLRVVTATVPRRLRTAWISDVHLGTRTSNAASLLSFLRDYEVETLYIVGDLIDGWQMQRGIYWPRSTTTSSKSCSARPGRERGSFTSQGTTTSSSAASAVGSPLPLDYIPNKEYSIA